jgi:asparaginyl-tRNA synthetase
MRPQIREIAAVEPDGREVEARGWVRTKREAKGLAFIELNDGSTFKGIQVVIESGPGLDEASARALAKAGTGASISVRGALVVSEGSGQSVEIKARSVELLGEAPPDYPLQKKQHSFEFLREIAHLRPRSNTFGAVARVRSELSLAVHDFFRARGFRLVHTPIITASDCEGAGAMFQVSTLDFGKVVAEAAKNGTGIDWSEDFFGKKAYLTVSGQLNAECYATALGRVYTFGPTFRAENSNTTRHLAEFWMIEPEMAFAELPDDMELAEAFVRHLVRHALEHCAEDLAFFDARIQPGLIATLEHVAQSDFAHLSYTDAMKELEKSAKRFEFPVSWGADLQSEHERFLTEEVAKRPLIVTDYPKEIKAFYMKMNPDGRTVRAMDVLVPRLGEIIGGSERESSLAALEARLAELGMRAEDYSWYLDLRRYGTVPHSGFGLGFERLMLYVTGMQNIRDVIPFPRAPRLADF